MAPQSKTNYIQWNIRGYYANLPYLQRILDEYSPIVVKLQETWLNIKNDVRIRGYNIIRKDREPKGGGVALLIRENIPYTNHKNNLELEAVSAKKLICEIIIILFAQSIFHQLNR